MSDNYDVPMVVNTTLKDDLAKGDDAEWFILDVRTTAEYNESHIPGAVNIPLHDVKGYLHDLHEDHGDAKIAIVCRTGQRACTAQNLLKGKDFKEAYVLHGGMVEWAKAGNPMQQGEGGMSIERQTRIFAGICIVLFSILAYVWTEWFLLGTGFFGAGLAFAGITDT